MEQGTKVIIKELAGEAVQRNTHMLAHMKNKDIGIVDKNPRKVGVRAYVEVSFPCGTRHNLLSHELKVVK